MKKVSDQKRLVMNISIQTGKMVRFKFIDDSTWVIHQIQRKCHYNNMRKILGERVFVGKSPEKETMVGMAMAFMGVRVRGMCVCVHHTARMMVAGTDRFMLFMFGIEVTEIDQRMVDRDMQGQADKGKSHQAGDVFHVSLIFESIGRDVNELSLNPGVVMGCCGIGDRASGSENFVENP